MYRLLHVYYPCGDIEKILKKFEVEIWKEKHGKECFAKILLPAEKSEDVINTLERHFSKYEGFRIIILPVEATVPREEENEKKEGEKERLSSEEIYEDLIQEAKFSFSFLALVILAAITASIGILYNNVAIIIGSMVIAPLLAPNMALALAATLADSKLAKHAIITSFIGYGIAIFIGFIFMRRYEYILFLFLLIQLFSQFYILYPLHRLFYNSLLLFYILLERFLLFA